MFPFGRSRRPDDGVVHRSLPRILFRQSAVCVMIVMNISFVHLCVGELIQEESAVTLNCSQRNAEHTIVTPGVYEGSNCSAEFKIIIASSDAAVRIRGGAFCPRIRLAEDGVFELTNVSITVEDVRTEVVVGPSSLLSLSEPLVSVALRRPAQRLVLQNISVRFVGCSLKFANAAEGIVLVGIHRSTRPVDIVAIGNITIELIRTSLVVEGRLGEYFIDVTAPLGFNNTRVAIQNSSLCANHTPMSNGIVFIDVAEVTNNGSAANDVAVIVEHSVMSVVMECRALLDCGLWRRPTALVLFFVTAVFPVTRWSFVSLHSSWSLKVVQTDDETTYGAGIVSWNGLAKTTGPLLRSCLVDFRHSVAELETSADGAVCHFRNCFGYEVMSIVVSHSKIRVRADNVLDSARDRRAAAVVSIDRNALSVASLVNATVVIKHIVVDVFVLSGVVKNSNQETNSSLFAVLASVLSIWMDTRHASFTLANVTATMDVRNGTVPLYVGMPPSLMTMTSTLLWLQRGLSHQTISCTVINSTLKSSTGSRVTERSPDNPLFATLFTPVKFLLSVVAAMSIGGNISNTSLLVKDTTVLIETCDFETTAAQCARLAVVPPRQPLSSTLHFAINVTCLINFLDTVPIFKLAQKSMYDLLSSFGSEALLSSARPSRLENSTVVIYACRVVVVTSAAIGFRPTSVDAYAYFATPPIIRHASITIDSGAHDVAAAGDFSGESAASSSTATTTTSSSSLWRDIPLHGVASLSPVDAYHATFVLRHLSNLSSGLMFGYGESLMLDSVVTLDKVTLRRAEYYTNASNVTAVVYVWPQGRGDAPLVVVRQSVLVDTIGRPVLSQPMFVLRSIAVAARSGFVALFPLDPAVFVLTRRVIVVEGNAVRDNEDPEVARASFVPAVMVAEACSMWEKHPIPLGNASLDDLVFGSTSVRMAVNTTAATCGIPPPDPPLSSTTGKLQLGSVGSTVIFAVLSLTVTSSSAVASLLLLRTSLAVVRYGTEDCSFEVGPMDNPLQASIPVATTTSQRGRDGDQFVNDGQDDVAVVAAQAQGAIFANIGLCLGVIWGVIGIGWLQNKMQKWKRKQVKAVDASLRTSWILLGDAAHTASSGGCSSRLAVELTAAAETSTVSGSGLLAVSLILQPTAACAVFLLCVSADQQSRSSQEAENVPQIQITSLVICGAVGVVWCVAVWLLVVLGACRLLPARMRHAFACVPRSSGRRWFSHNVSCADMTGFLNTAAGFQRWCEDRWRWRVISARSDPHVLLSAAAYRRIFGSLFEDYRQNGVWLLGLEQAVAIAVGVIFGMTDGSRIACTTACWMICGVFVVLGASALFVRPFIAQMKDSWFVIGAALTALCSLLQAIGEDDAAERASIAQLIIIAAQIVFGWMLDLYDALTLGDYRKLPLHLRIVFSCALSSVPQDPTLMTGTSTYPPYLKAQKMLPLPAAQPPGSDCYETLAMLVRLACASQTRTTETLRN